MFILSSCMYVWNDVVNQRIAPNRIEALCVISYDTLFSICQLYHIIIFMFYINNG